MLAVKPRVLAASKYHGDGGGPDMPPVPAIGIRLPEVVTHTSLVGYRGTVAFSSGE
jgi:hypothetical protein